MTWSHATRMARRRKRTDHTSPLVPKVDQKYTVTGFSGRREINVIVYATSYKDASRIAVGRHALNTMMEISVKLSDPKPPVEPERAEYHELESPAEPERAEYRELEAV